jgi:starch synthase
MSRHDPHAPRALHISSEVAPYSKTGGLGDVAASLPRALAKAGVRPFVVTPRYRSIDPLRHALARRLSPIDVPLGPHKERVTIYEGTLAGGVVPCFFLDHPVFDREGVYGDANGEFGDNPYRFALLTRAALELAHQLDLWPDVVHAHDWQAALAPVYAKLGIVRGRPIPKTVLTIHNLAFQGLTDKNILDHIGLPWSVFTPEAGEFYDAFCMLKAGISAADRITAVSPRYAREIQTPEQGFGLDGFLRARRDRIVGILNGIDVDVWNPERDAALPARYDAKDRAGKAVCKTALLRELGLPVRAATPLFGSVSRLTDQKGFDLVRQAGEELARLDAQYVFLGSGDRRHQDALAELARRYPTKVAVRFGYDEALAHRIEAGSDLYLMPSRYEPCGLNQMYSLRYGTIPIVRAVGGLDDTVVDYDERTRTGNGFKFSEFTGAALYATVRRALSAYRHRDAWAELIERVMQLDHSWAASGRRYAELYRGLLGHPRAGQHAA